MTDVRSLHYNPLGSLTDNSIQNKCRININEGRQRRGKTVADSFLETFASMTSVGWLAQFREVEGIIQLLASNASSYITATNLAVDGGLSSMLRPHATTR